MHQLQRRTHGPEEKKDDEARKEKPKTLPHIECDVTKECQVIGEVKQKHEKHRKTADLI
jgi:hypothetical protein